MGNAAYNRGSKAISAQIDRDTVSKGQASFKAGLAQGWADSNAEISKLRAGLKRAERAIRLEAAKLTYERGRGEKAVALLQTRRDRCRGKVGPGAYATIVALGVVKEELGR